MTPTLACLAVREDSLEEVVPETRRRHRGGVERRILMKQGVNQPRTALEYSIHCRRGLPETPPEKTPTQQYSQSMNLGPPLPLEKPKLKTQTGPGFHSQCLSEKNKPTFCYGKCPAYESRESCLTGGHVDASPSIRRYQLMDNTSSPHPFPLPLPTLL